jgi:hypothetical protein
MRKEGREWIEIKVGTKLIAVDDYEETLIIGKEYEVLEVDECNFDFTVKSELHNRHTFDFEDAKETIFKIKEEYEAPKHYDNTNGSLYKVATERGWNSYLFDIVKRLERANKKGEFETDLQKSKLVIDLWLQESK